MLYPIVIIEPTDRTVCFFMNPSSLFVTNCLDYLYKAYHPVWTDCSYKHAVRVIIFGHLETQETEI